MSPCVIVSELTNFQASSNFALVLVQDVLGLY
ncbi:MAG: hypothetical protein [Enterobacteria phage RP5]|nr:MAG: hypothetical protein [Enterobacteria phage RP5]